MDLAAADEFFDLVRQLQESRAYRTLEGIRSEPRAADCGDGGFPSELLVVKSEDVINEKEDNEINKWLESVVTVLSLDDLHKAQQFLLRFNDMHPNEQRDLVTMILKNIQTKITNNLQIETMQNSDPDIFVIENLIEIANKSFSAKQFEKAHDLLVKAMAIKQTPKAQTLLEKVKRELQYQRNVICQKLIQCAMTAFHDDDYDIAEILLKATWIQYKHEPADKMIKVFFENEDSRRTKNISSKTKEQLKDVSQKYQKIAEGLICQGHFKVAELVLIVAGNIDSAAANKLLSDIHVSLYPNTAISLIKEWQICDYGWCGSEKRLLRLHSPMDSTNNNKCYFFLKMAFRMFYYADNIQLAEELLKEASRFNPSSTDVDIKDYLKTIENAKKKVPKK